MAAIGLQLGSHNYKGEVQTHGIKKQLICYLHKITCKNELHSWLIFSTL